MTRRHSDGDRSAFFFLGSLEPAELANFNVQNVFLPDGSVLELMGHGAGLWWGARLAREFDDVRDTTRDWLETIAALYFLETGTALSVRLSGWVEALDVDVKEAVLGFIDERFRVVPAVGEEHEANAPMRWSIDVAGRLRGVTHLQPAVTEVWRSALDPSDEAFLSAFRSLECLRRLYGPDCTVQDVGAAWSAMAADLEVGREPYELLREAAKAVRHGDRPVRRADDHPVNTARDRRAELLAYATGLVKHVLEKRLPVADPE